MALVGSVVLAASALSGAHAADVTEPVLLVAKPELGEFYRSTVLFVRPMGNGRHVGFIINRPTPMTLGKLFPEHAPSQKVTNPVLLGGPVNVDSVFAVVHREAVPGDKSIPLSPICRSRSTPPRSTGSSSRTATPPGSSSASWCGSRASCSPSCRRTSGS
jgi:hypothetical protein